MDSGMFYGVQKGAIAALKTDEQLARQNKIKPIKKEEH